LKKINKELSALKQAKPCAKSEYIVKKKKRKGQVHNRLYSMGRKDKILDHFEESKRLTSEVQFPFQPNMHSKTKIRAEKERVIERLMKDAKKRIQKKETIISDIVKI